MIFCVERSVSSLPQNQSMTEQLKTEVHQLWQFYSENSHLHYGFHCVPWDKSLPIYLKWRPSSVDGDIKQHNLCNPSTLAWSCIFMRTIEDLTSTTWQWTAKPQGHTTLHTLSCLYTMHTVAYWESCEKLTENEFLLPRLFTKPALWGQFSSLWPVPDSKLATRWETIAHYIGPSPRTHTHTYSIAFFMRGEHVTLFGS